MKMSSQSEEQLLHAEKYGSNVIDSSKPAQLPCLQTQITPLFSKPTDINGNFLSKQHLYQSAPIITATLSTTVACITSTVTSAEFNTLASMNTSTILSTSAGNVTSHKPFETPISLSSIEAGIQDSMPSPQLLNLYPHLRTSICISTTKAVKGNKVPAIEPCTFKTTVNPQNNAVDISTGNSSADKFQLPVLSETQRINMSTTGVQSLVNNTLGQSSGVKSATTFAKKDLDQTPQKTTSVVEESSIFQQELPQNLSGNSALTTEPNLKSEFEHYIQSCCPDATLLGLKYVTEYLGGSRCARYICGLCCSLFEGSDIAYHVVSLSHRMIFIKEDFPNIYKILSQRISSLNGVEFWRECEWFAKKCVVKSDCIRTLCHKHVDRYLQLDLASIQNAGLDGLEMKRANLIQKIDKTMSIGTALESQIDRLLHVAKKSNPDNSAVVGLKFITEIIEREPGVVTYVCRCCQETICSDDIGMHILGTNHRIKFFVLERPDIIINRIGDKRSKSCQELFSMCLQEAKLVEERDGLCQILTISKAQQFLLEARYGKLVDLLKPESKKNNVTPIKGDSSLPVVPVWCGMKKNLEPDLALIPFLEDQSVLKVAKQVNLQEGKDCLHYYKYILMRGAGHENLSAGLKYVTEVQRCDGKALYGYYCNLCKFTSQGPDVIHQHVCGNPHVIKYLEQDHPYIYGKIMLETEEGVRRNMTQFYVKELHLTDTPEAINAVIVTLEGDKHNAGKSSRSDITSKKNFNLPQTSSVYTAQAKGQNNNKNFPEILMEGENLSHNCQTKKQNSESDVNMLLKSHAYLKPSQKLDAKNFSNAFESFKNNLESAEVLPKKSYKDQNLSLSDERLQNKSLNDKMHSVISEECQKVSQKSKENTKPSQNCQGDINSAWKDGQKNILHGQDKKTSHQEGWNRSLHKHENERQLHKQDLKPPHRNENHIHEKTLLEIHGEQKLLSEYFHKSVNSQDVPLQELEAQKALVELEIQKCSKSDKSFDESLHEKGITAILRKDEEGAIQIQDEKQTKKANLNPTNTKVLKLLNKLGKQLKETFKIEQSLQERQLPQKMDSRNACLVKNIDQTSKTERSAAAQMQLSPDSNSIKIYRLLKEECSNKPVIGLQYLQETVMEGTEYVNKYQCKLCGLDLTEGTVCKHLIGSEHRFKYLEKHYSELLQEIKQSPNLLEMYCCWIDATNGREDCTFRKLLTHKTTDGKPVYSTVKSVKDIEYSSPWKGVYTLEALRILSKTSVTDNLVHSTSDNCEKSVENVEDEKVETDITRDCLTEISLDEKSFWKNELEKLKEDICSKRIIKCQKMSKFLAVCKEKAYQTALIGLKEIIEIQHINKEAEPRYLCFLCEEKLSWQEIFKHVISSEHRLQYMNCSYQYLYRLATSDKPYFMSIESFAKEIASTEGDGNDLQVLMDFTQCAVEQQTRGEVKANSKDSIENVCKSKDGRKRNGSGDDGSPKSKRQVLKDFGCQNAIEINSKEKNTSENRDSTSLSKDQKNSTVQGDLDSRQDKENWQKVQTSYEENFSRCDRKSTCNLDAIDYENVAKPNFAESDSEADRDTVGYIENVSTKRKLEKVNTSLQHTVLHNTDSPEKKRIRSKPLFKTDNIPEKCTKVSDVKKEDSKEMEQKGKIDSLKQLIDEYPHLYVIGLDYIIEIQHSVMKELPPLYRCTICSETSLDFLVAKDMLHHVCSRIHQDNFFKTDKHGLHEEMQTNAIDKAAYNALLDQYAKLFQEKTCKHFNTILVEDASPWQKKFYVNKSEKEIFGTLVQLQDGCLPVKICHYVSPSEIHFQLKKTDRTAWKELMKKMQVAYKNSKQDSKDKWEVGMFCSAFLMAEKLWYRGKITSEAPHKRGFLVFLIDYGSTHAVSEHNLRRVHRQFQTIPCLSFCCKLCDLRPGNNHVEWPPSTVVLVKNAIQKGNLFIEKKAKLHDGKVPVDLLVENEDIQTNEKTYMSLSLFLLLNGLAVKNVPVLLK